jgi:phosphate transport system protein
MSELDRRIPQLFALVTEALAGATEALLAGQSGVGRAIVDADKKVDEITRELERAVWAEIDSQPLSGAPLHHLVALLLILPELERSADLAEHIAQRAVNNLGSAMSPTSRGIVQQMSDVALAMWTVAAESYRDGISRADELAKADDEIDALRDRLVSEVTANTMSIDTASQVALLARFYERLGDHAVNLARRIASIPNLGGIASRH